MLFQRVQFCASSSFLHEEGLAGKVAKGRREFLVQFPSLATLELTWPPKTVTAPVMADARELCQARVVTGVGAEGVRSTRPVERSVLLGRTSGVPDAI